LSEKDATTGYNGTIKTPLETEAMNIDTNAVMDTIKTQIEQHPVLLYMKGTPELPQCGFSARVVHILKSMNTNFAYVNILAHPEIRATLPKYANWPTFPQLYITGELIGGCDIVTDMQAAGELQPLLASANALGTGDTVAA
jgi:monothiol glutaredoxin